MIGAPAATSPGLVAIAASMLADRPDQAACVLVQPDGSDVAQRLAARIGADRIFVHAATPPPWQTGIIPITLAAEDQDITAPRPALWPGSLLPARSRRRRIDTLYADRAIGLLILADPATAAAILCGAASVVADQRPAVLLDLRAADTADARQITDAVLAALPGYAWAAEAGTTPLALPPGATPPDLRALASPDRDTISTAFDFALAGAGLHPPEPDAPHGGRWTGAAPATWFMLPRPGPGRWTLRLDIADWGNAAAGFAAEVDDRPIILAALNTEAAEYGPFDLDSPCGGVLRVTLFPPRAARDMQRGPRLIGLRILRAILQRAA